MYNEDWDEGSRDLEDSKLLRLTRGEAFEAHYTVSAEPKLNGMRSSDTKLFVIGNKYEAAIGNRRWRWMFEDEMPTSLSEEERKAMLARLERVVWKPECLEMFEVVA